MSAYIEDARGFRARLKSAEQDTLGDHSKGGDAIEKKVNYKNTLLDIALVAIGWVSFVIGIAISTINKLCGIPFSVIARILP